MFCLLTQDFPVLPDSAEDRTFRDFSDYKPAFSISADQQVSNRVVGAYCRSSLLVNPLSLPCQGRRHNVRRFRPLSENRREIARTPDESDIDQLQAPADSASETGATSTHRPARNTINRPAEGALGEPALMGSTSPRRGEKERHPVLDTGSATTRRCPWRLGRRW